jgi:hypothetical protein
VTATGLPRDLNNERNHAGALNLGAVINSVQKYVSEVAATEEYKCM